MNLSLILFPIPLKTDHGDDMTKKETKIKQHLPSIVWVWDPGVIIKEDPDTLVAELEAEPVLVAVVDPLGDEGGGVLWQGRWLTTDPGARHTGQGRRQGLVQASSLRLYLM